MARAEPLSPRRSSARCRGRTSCKDLINDEAAAVAASDTTPRWKRRCGTSWPCRSTPASTSSPTANGGAKSYIGVIAELAHGFELGRNPADGRPWTVVVDKLSPKKPGFIAQRDRLPEEQSPSARSRRRCRPRPCWASGCGTPSKSAEGLSATAKISCATACRSCAARWSCIREAGVDIIQIDDPHLCLFVDPDGARRTIDDADAAADFAVDMVNAVVEGIEGVKLAVHLCRRAGARVRGEAEYQGDYDPIIPQLNKLKVHHLTMEFTTTRRRRHDGIQEAARRFRDRPGLRQRPARPDRFCWKPSSHACGGRRNTSRRNGSRSTPIAALRRARARRSASMKPTASCATRWRRQGCCGTSFPNGRPRAFADDGSPAVMRDWCPP